MQHASSANPGPESATQTARCAVGPSSSAEAASKNQEMEQPSPYANKGKRPPNRATKAEVEALKAAAAAFQSRMKFEITNSKKRKVEEVYSKWTNIHAPTPTLPFVLPQPPGPATTPPPQSAAPPTPPTPPPVHSISTASLTPATTPATPSPSSNVFIARVPSEAEDCQTNGPDVHTTFEECIRSLNREIERQRVRIQQLEKELEAQRAISEKRRQACLAAEERVLAMRTKLCQFAREMLSFSEEK